LLRAMNPGIGGHHSLRSPHALRVSARLSLVL
jgi:hypothetical protein